MSMEHVYKKCKSEIGHECLVTLEKPLEGFMCNESRSSVINKEFAKFRCNGLLAVSIFDLFFKENLYSILHKTKVRSSKIFTEYKVGFMVKPNCFDDDMEEVYAPRIHYFLTCEAARCYDLDRGWCKTINHEILGEDGDLLYPIKK
jgi:hypothetical protein